MSIFSENLLAEQWFNQQNGLGDNDWSELYSLYEHMHEHVGLYWEAIRPVLEETSLLMMEGKWNGLPPR